MVGFGPTRKGDIMQKVLINTIEESIEFASKNIDSLGIIINHDRSNPMVRRRTIIKMSSEGKYIYCVLDDIGQSPFKEAILEEVANIVYDLRNYINYDRCFSIGNGRTPIYLTMKG